MKYRSCLESLDVSSNPSVRDQLGWYLAVSANRMPAKYLICRRIPCQVDLKDASEDELWDSHEKLTEKFLRIWNSIRRDETHLDDLQNEYPSLLDLNIELVNRMLTHCNFCRWNCRVNRVTGGRHGTCQLESISRVGSYFHHNGEEIVFRGTAGSGTIFFTSCNMRCAFCQNGDISRDKENGVPVTPELLAHMAWQLRTEGCHNINFVGGEPTIHLHTILGAIGLLSFRQPQARKTFYWSSTSRTRSESFSFGGQFNVPILWNSNFFMSSETMRLLRTVIDVWLPDFKFGNNKCAIHLSRTPWYFETVAQNHKLIYDWGEDFVIRHLIMPNHVDCCTKPVLDWISENILDVLVNIMDQYHPDCFVDPCASGYDPKYSDIDRVPDRDEILESYSYALSLGLNFEPLSYEKNMTGLRA